MTVQNTASFIDYTGDDVTTSFPFTFRVDDVSWLTVDFTDDFDTFLLNLDQENNPGGSAEYLVAVPAPGSGGPDPSFRIERLTPNTQDLNYTRYDPFDSESHENALDKLTMQIQDGITYVDTADALLQEQIDDNTLLITTGISPGHQHVEADIVDLGNYTSGTVDEDITGFWEFINVAGMAVWDAGKNGGAQFRTSLGGFEISPLGVNDRIWVNGRFEITRAGVVADSTSFIHDGINVVWDGQNAAAIELTGFTDRIIQGAEVYAYLSDIVAGGTPGGADTEVQFNNLGVFDGDALLAWDGANLTATTFNSVPLTAAGLITDFLNATGTYSVPGGGGGAPGGADTNIQYNNAGSFGGDANLTWGVASQQMLINQVGGSGAAIRFTNLRTAQIVLNIGGSGSSTQRWEIFRSTDSSGSFSWRLLDDHLLSSGNHKLQFMNQDSDIFLEMDNSGEMTLGGQQGLGSLQLEGIGGTLKMICMPVGNGGLYMREISGAGAAIAGDGQWWVRDRTVCQPWFTDDANVSRPFAFAVARRVATNGDWNMNTGANDYNTINGIAMYDDGNPYTITTEDDSSFNWPFDCSFQVVARGGGTITIAEGSGITIYVDDGSGFVDSAGGCTLVDGAATIYRVNTAEVRVWGSGLSP